ncbi:MAG: secretion protein [Sphaerospermopsis sp. SIO1G2]|nr:secretion protein [Sphaerospermopsis sp. SIO1G1]NET70181.1 secretion protein [Sphaerospermopsis sp. SIO1G2]
MNKLFTSLSVTTGAAFTFILAGVVPNILDSVTTKPAIAQTGIDVAAVRSSALSKHNNYRSTHNTPAMTMSNSLNNTAQEWAEYLASNGTFQHSSSSQRNGAGENIYVYYTTAGSANADTITKGVKSWYDEVSKYDYNNPGFSGETGHFTQVVWKSSTQLGCGAAKGVKTLGGNQYNAFYLVCQYGPAGNVMGQFPANVLKP